MHPEVKSRKRGKCSKCGMTLRPASDEIVIPAVESSSSESNANVEAVKQMQIPDTSVLDQDGRKLRFYSDLVKGKVVAINFIFTTCTTICPPLTATFRRLQEELEKRGSNNVQLISISVDPATDVPERLKAFAADFRAAEGWTFVTGDKQQIRSLLSALGAAVEDKNNHTPMVLIGNDKVGYWTRTYGLAPVSKLVELINDAMTRTSASVSKLELPKRSHRTTLNEAKRR
jgi:cytochrome oxidase Cu insertion factor (SCO1/SenC/PrrC family)